ncbi:hypothetical protein D9M68_674590 [compost metagenome]
MILADYLTVQAGASPEYVFQMLGETGFSMPAASCPSSPLRHWQRDEALPPAACLLLEQGLHLSGICGLVRAVSASASGPEAEAAWILARSDQGLVSIVVRGAAGASARRLREDAALALRQAARYLAGYAVVLAQANRGDESMEGYLCFAGKPGREQVRADTLYANRDAGTGTMFACAWLGHSLTAAD